LHIDRGAGFEQGALAKEARETIRLTLKRQNAVTIRVGSDLERSPGLASCSKQDQHFSLDQVAQHFLQAICENVRGWRFCTLSGQPVPMLSCPLVEMFFLTFS